MSLLMALHSLQRSEGFFKVYSRLLCRTMLYDDIATTIIPLPSVTKTFAMSTVLCSTVVGKKRHRKAERHRKTELARAEARALAG